MEIKILNTGMFQSNSYIVEDNGECIIIDCGVDVQEILKTINLKVKYIILTHGHIDHIISVDSLKEKTNAKVLIHEEDKNMLTDAFANGSGLLMRNSMIFEPADKTLKDKDIIEFGNESIQIIHTPGHTKGCICIKMGRYIFTGDTLFNNSIGRTDLKGGSYKDIIKSIKEKLFNQEDNCIVLPGHGFKSTIGNEKASNPFLR